MSDPASGPASDRFELRRRGDGLVYHFRRRIGADGRPAWQRQDRDLWITWRPAWGWVAWDADSSSCMGRPWNVLPQDQTDAPPAGIWVSRKGDKSHVYDLVYVGAGGNAGGDPEGV